MSVRQTWPPTPSTLLGDGHNESEKTSGASPRCSGEASHFKAPCVKLQRGAWCPLKPLTLAQRRCKAILSSLDSLAVHERARRELGAPMESNDVPCLAIALRLLSEKFRRPRPGKVEVGAEGALKGLEGTCRCPSLERLLVDGPRVRMHELTRPGSNTLDSKYRVTYHCNITYIRYVHIFKIH